MEIAMVRKEYRGQGLQRKMMEESEQILKEQGYHYLLGNGTSGQCGKCEYIPEITV